MVDVDGLLRRLTLAEKASLTAGADMWSTVAVDHLAVPAVGMTDGPNGVRGQDLPGVASEPSVCLPCGSAQGATWDPDLLAELGALLGREARGRGCRVLLAPTVNLHRHPLAGRNFECYSEDPLLSGRLAAGFVRGVQGEGVVATVKHLVANETEHERSTSSSVVDDRTLRELYLLPFEMAVREGGALGIMTSYNRLNGRWLTERSDVLQAILRDEWGFGGLVMTDWFAVADTERSPVAGVDIEMPGPGRSLGPVLGAAVEQGTVDEGALDAMVRRLLTALDAVGALDGPTPPTPAVDRVEDRALVRRAAARATVLLTNDGVLPLDPASGSSVAVVGPFGTAPALTGGGAANVSSFPAVDVVESLRAALPTWAVTAERGVDVGRGTRPLGSFGLRGRDGFTTVVRDPSGAVVATSTRAELALFGLPDGAGEDWVATVSGRVEVAESGTYVLAVAQAARAVLSVDGRVVFDGSDGPPPYGGTELFGLTGPDATADVDLVAGSEVEIEVELRPHPDALVPAVRIGFRPPDPPDLLDRAVAAAAAADVAVVVVGTGADHEREQFDRETFALPGDQDELVRRVAVVNDRTVVVVNAAAAVDLPWVDEVAAVVQCWFGGQEIGPALAEVLSGVVEPGGRLPVTVPERIEHVPSHDNFPGENGEVRYGEGVFMGYRGHDHRALPVRFPFGHGLTYTAFELGCPTVVPTFVPGSTVEVRVPVTNVGDRAGSEVVQLYVEPPSPRLARPPRELKGWARIELDPGETGEVTIALDDRSFAYWDPGQPDRDEVVRRASTDFVEGPKPAARRAAGWQVDPGTYRLLVGHSSRNLPQEAEIEVDRPRRTT
ncbi:MAG: glycoside hydrolase family 3 protein [Actinobacteria bacterium]|nr:glycoside hydrolase family 3 protein [Actinomycetota bacterium]